MILGGFYSDSTRPRDYEWNTPGLGAATGSPSNLILSFIDSREATEEAVFGDVSYDMLPNLKATAGCAGFATPPRSTSTRTARSTVSPRPLISRRRPPRAALPRSTCWNTR